MILRSLQDRLHVNSQAKEVTLLRKKHLISRNRGDRGLKHTLLSGQEEFALFYFLKAGNQLQALTLEFQPTKTGRGFFPIIFRFCNPDAPVTLMRRYR